MKKHDNISSFEPELNKRKNALLSFERLHMKDLLFMLYDIVAVTVAYFFALWFRFDCRFSEIPEKYLMAWMKFAPIYAVISITVFWIFHLYQSIWKYASIAEVKRILCASGILAILHTALITLLFCRMPISYYIIGVAIQFILLVSVRFAYRFVSMERSKNAKLSQAVTNNRVMLIGAGDAGQMILRDMQNSPHIADVVCCIIDDDKKKQGRLLYGVPIVGGREDILLNVEKYGIGKIYLAMPGATADQRRDILDVCKETSCQLKSLPGIAEIVTAMEYLLAHPEIKHGKIRVAFNPDEEIGKGAHKFDVEAFGADWAYTMDGGEIGELEYENFNAAVARITFKGRNVHPGYAKHKMINSIRIANQYAIMLPRWETPEHTEGYEGFYHLISFEGNVEQTVLTYIIRDHDRDRFERRKKELEHLTRKINNEFPDCASIEINDQYYTMREKVEPVMHIVDLVSEAMRAVDVVPQVKPVRGGTDGAQLSFKGLPCPNIFAGGLNFHGRYEFVPIQSMEKATEVIVQIAKMVAEK